jgi:endonuclease/exonuclease/phosphatase (EEP) superfamily protein YafD
MMRTVDSFVLSVGGQIEPAENAGREQRIKKLQAEILEEQRLQAEEEKAEETVNRVRAGYPQYKNLKDEKLGALSKSILIRDFIYYLGATLKIQVEFDPIVAQKTMAEIMWLMEGSDAK